MDDCWNWLLPESATGGKQLVRVVVNSGDVLKFGAMSLPATKLANHT
jgi:hypothetical protein